MLFSIQWLWRENKYFIFTHETEGRLGEKTSRKEGKARKMLICGKFAVMRVALRNKGKLSSMNSRKKENQEMKAIYFKLSLRLFLITLREFEFEKLSKKICFPSFEAHKKRKTLKFHSRQKRKISPVLSSFWRERKSLYGIFHTGSHRNACYTTPKKETKK